MGVRKSYESKGYSVGAGTAEKDLKQACVYLSSDVVAFMDDYAYQAKKRGVFVSASALIRVALRSFMAMSAEEQSELLMDDK